MGIFSGLFKKKQRLLDPADISLLKVDIHSHLIPGIDDGAQNMDESIEMLREFASLGIKKVITTPHIMSDFYRNTPAIILEGAEKVRAVLKSEGIDIEIEAAAEYYLDDVFEDLLRDDDIITFGDKYLLFELPFVSEPANLARAVFNMQLQSYKPILAHPERYTYWHNDFSKYEDMHDKGVLLQVNINSLSGLYSPEVKTTAERLIDEGMVSLIGTDCHRMDHLKMMKNLTSRMPHFHKVLEQGNLLNHKV
jgi:tyrosine-protein phosphatase YwqE